MSAFTALFAWQVMTFDADWKQSGAMPWPQLALFAPFIAVALWQLLAPLRSWRASRHMRYALTSERLVLVRGKRRRVIESVVPNVQWQLRVVENDRGTGSIEIDVGADRKPQSFHVNIGGLRFSGAHWPSLVGIDNPRQVERLLLDRMKTQGAQRDGAAGRAV